MRSILVGGYGAIVTYEGRSGSPCPIVAEVETEPVKEAKMGRKRKRISSEKGIRRMLKTNQLKMLAVAAALCLLALVAVQPVEAAFPGNNGKIIFWSDRSAGPGLYTTTAGGTATKIPGTSGGDNHAVWSPDGSRITFMSPSASNYEISVMNADGSGRRQLTATPVAEQEPTWSPDGSQIAFVKGASDTDATTDLEIWVMNADGSGLTQLTNTANGVRDTQPAWSPDGNRIAFVSEGRTGDTNSNIYVMDTDPATDDASNLTPNDFTTNPVYQPNDEDPSWSPDGTQITYSTIQDVWKMNANGTGKTNLTTGSGGAQPAWSPDGNSIVYARVDVTNGVNNQNIYVMDTNGGNKTPVDTTLRKDEKPDWQQDSIPPATTITSGPPNPTRSTTASFGFVSSEADSTFQCSLNGAPFSACVSPKSYTALTNGSHTFRVQATDVAGNLDATSASRTWTVDTIKPTVSGMSPRHKSITRDTTPSIRAVISDNTTNLRKANIKLYVAGKKITRFSYSAATNKLVYNSSKLPKGRKTVKIIATDAAGNVGVKSWYFTIR